MVDYPVIIKRFSISILARRYILELHYMLCCLLIASVGVLAQEGRNACPNGTPEMSNTFSALAIEEQYISLRELKGRTAEALLSQKNTIDQQRAAVDKILSEQKGMRL